MISGQAEVLLRTAEGSLEQFDTKLEIFRDRMTSQSDEMQTMRSTFSRLEQLSNELRTADAYKAHDIQVYITCLYVTSGLAWSRGLIY